MPFKEIKKRDNFLRLTRYDKEGFILIPPLFRKHFGGKVKLLFDPENNLIALQPSDAVDDYPTSRYRVWCTNFFKEYGINTQQVEAKWDPNRKYLVAKILREE